MLKLLSSLCHNYDLMCDECQVFNLNAPAAHIFVIITILNMTRWTLVILSLTPTLMTSSSQTIMRHKLLPQNLHTYFLRSSCLMMMITASKSTEKTYIVRNSPKELHIIIITYISVNLICFHLDHFQWLTTIYLENYYHHYHHYHDSYSWCHTWYILWCDHFTWHSGVSAVKTRVVIIM